VVHEAVDGARHGDVWKDLVSLAEGLIGGDRDELSLAGSALAGLQIARLARVEPL
jgi:hypothetical protein